MTQVISQAPNRLATRRVLVLFACGALLAAIVWIAVVAGTRPDFSFARDFSSFGSVYEPVSGASGRSYYADWQDFREAATRELLASGFSEERASFQGQRVRFVRGKERVELLNGHLSRIKYWDEPSRKGIEMAFSRPGPVVSYAYFPGRSDLWRKTAYSVRQRLGL